jgi:hypothetical protein
LAADRPYKDKLYLKKKEKGEEEKEIQINVA